jgi:hypothetical protein
MFQLPGKLDTSRHAESKEKGQKITSKCTIKPGTEDGLACLLYPDVRRMSCACSLPPQKKLGCSDRQLRRLTQIDGMEEAPRSSHGDANIAAP